MVKVTSSNLILNNTLTQQKKMGITGSIGMWVGSSAPAGALFCDGTTYNRSQYPLLANSLGVTSGLTFNVPNLQGTLPRGTNSTTPPPDGSLRKTGGNLQIQSIGHTHTINQSRFLFLFEKDRPEEEGDSGIYVYFLQPESTSNVTTTNNASDTQIDYLPPYLAVNFIIYT